jgi:hypothetical protein
MYISIERNVKGNLEIDDNVINQQVEYIVSNKITAAENIEVNVGIHNENNVFIIVKMKVKNRAEFENGYDMIELTNQISDAIYNTLTLRPKSISFAYIH